MTPAEDLIVRFRGGDILPDSNLLLLLLIGSFERQRIRIFKRTAAFSELDFDLLATFLSHFRGRKTTPHVLTEVSNLANALPEHLKSAWFAHFSAQVGAFFEVYEESKALMKGDAFHLFGLTDAALCSISSDTLILTKDGPLTGFLRSRNLPVLNFDELRALALDQPM